MKLSLMFFNAEGTGSAPDVYRHVLDVARMVDGTAIEAIWFPERHHHQFGGPFPEPAVLASAVAARTQHVQLRAGSVVVALHDPIRVAERWAMVDNIAGPGRVGLSLAAGWNANDFWPDPSRFERRYDLLADAIPEIRQWWSSDSHPVQHKGGTVDLRLFPQPLSPELPLWVTVSGSPQTWELAARQGAGVLTHLLGQSVDVLRERILAFRQDSARRSPVAVMLHTFVAEDQLVATTTAEHVLIEYFGRALDLDIAAKGAAPMATARRDELIRNRVRHHLDSTALIGGPERVNAVVRDLAEAGVDEIACLIDFGLPASQQLAGVETLLSHWPTAVER